MRRSILHVKQILDWAQYEAVAVMRFPPIEVAIVRNVGGGRSVALHVGKILVDQLLQRQPGGLARLYFQ